MDNFQKALEINCKEEEERIIKFIKRSLVELNREGAVIGLSGGLCSSTCAYLLEKALDKDKILALILPERDNSPVNMEHARLVAKNLGLKTKEINITDVLEKIGVYEVGPEEIKSEKDLAKLKKMDVIARKIISPYVISDSLTLIHGGKPSTKFSIVEKLTGKNIHGKTAFSLTKVRIRMVYLYFHAWLNKYAVMGTTDKTEYTMGMYDVHGDGANDITPLRHLYKTQIRKLAEYIGVPREITEKPSSGDLYGNVSNEETFGITYEKLDRLFYGIERGCSEEELLEIVPKEALNRFKRCIETANMGRSLPLSLS